MRLARCLAAALLLCGCEIGTCPSLSRLPAPRAGAARWGLGWGLGWGLEGCGSFFAGHCAAEVFRRATGQLGGRDLRLTLLRVAREQLLLRAQVPGHPEEFDDYVVDLEGNLSLFSPVKRMPGDGLEHRVFRAGEVSIELVPELRRRALTALKLDGARVTSIRVALGPAPPARFDVDASSPRGDGSAVFDNRGQLLAVNRP